jgi:hypothetical protein
MSIRKDYWLVTADGRYDGPYTSISEAKADTDTIPVAETITVQAMVAFTRRDEQGKWHTLH